MSASTTKQIRKLHAAFLCRCGLARWAFVCDDHGLQKRKGHNVETWALFINFVQALDSVQRDALFAVLRRFGLPDHFVNIIIRLLHENVRFGA